MNLPLNVDFSGKVVVITGAGGVLCGEMARAYAQAGAKVAALDLNEEAVQKLADELTAVCAVCGDDAPYHQRVVSGDVGDAAVPTAAHVGGIESYQARCRRHFEGVR